VSSACEVSFEAVRAADIAPSSVSWLWEPYLAYGKLAAIDGEPEAGKSFVTIDIAARLSRGAPPPGGTAPMKPGVALFLNAEDNARDTILPRLAAAGADLERVRILAAPGLGLPRMPQFPADLPALGRAIREHGAEFVVIDPMMAFLPPAVNANNDQSIRTALTPLADLAAETHAVVVLVRHPRKAGGVSAVYRGAGSVGIMGAVRTGLMIAQHPDDPDLRVLAMPKTNIGLPGRSLGFRLRPGAGVGQTVVEWCGPVDVTAQDLWGGPPARAGRATRDRAVEWLRLFLANGERVMTEVVKAAAAAGIAERTLYRAKEALGVKSRMAHRGGGPEYWWRDPKVPLPEDRPPLDLSLIDLETLESLFGPRSPRPRKSREPKRHDPADAAPPE
jgi:AAA domain